MDNLSIIDKRENINLISKQNQLNLLPYPLISPADKVSSTISKTTSINIDTLLKTIGFQNFPKVLKHYKLHPKITSTFKILDVIYLSTKEIMLRWIKNEAIKYLYNQMKMYGI